MTVKFYLESDLEEIISRIKPLANLLSGKKVLITGAQGFLGKYFLEIFYRLNNNFLEKPLNIVALDNFITSVEEKSYSNDYKNIHFFKHDVIEPFNHEVKYDYIIHAAGIASPNHYKAYPIKTIEVTINGTKNLLNLAKKIKSKFLYFSSSEIYGDPNLDNIPTDENYRGNVTCQGPRACYDESKRLGETLCYVYNTTENIHTNIIRPFNIYGPGMKENDYRVMPNFANCIKGNKKLKVYGKGSQTRTFCYITDAMVGFFSVMLNGKNGETYNIGNHKPEIQMIKLAEMFIKLSRQKRYVEIVDYPSTYPPDEPNRRVPNIDKAKSDLLYAPNVSLEAGLERFLNWTSLVYKGN